MRFHWLSIVCFGCAALVVAAGDPPVTPKPTAPNVLPSPTAVGNTTSDKSTPKASTTAQVAALKSELESLIREREATTKPVIEEPNSLSERTKLKSKVLSMIERLDSKKSTPPPMMPPAKTPETVSTAPKIDIAEGSTDSDRLRSAENYFRSNNIEASVRVLNMTDTANLNRDERTFAEYLKACCLRKLGKAAEAKVLYRKIADEKSDEFLVESSLTQLQLLNQSQEIEDRLKQLRTSRKKQ